MTVPQSNASAALLVELFTEELPPKALKRLGDAFADGIAAGLAQHGLLADAGAVRAAAGNNDGAVQTFATPRRLAVLLPHVIGRAPDRSVELKGPSLKVGLDANGAPTQALHKWAQKQGVSVESLRQGSDGKQDVFFADSVVHGQTLDAVLPAVIDETLSRLPIPKVMQYQLADGKTNVSFVRPAHGLIALHGERIVAATVLGLTSGRTTRGHRFQSAGELSIATAGDYERVLEQQGRVIAGYPARRSRIETALRARASELNASLGDESGVAPLLDEVTALVEWPAVYVGRFEAQFLQVPQECLILTMRTNQKYFPLFDAQGKLIPEFLIVSNMDVADPHFIIDGNQRVVRPRLADARFFFDTDKKTRLDARVAQLAAVVYHARLGSQAQRSERVRQIAAAIAKELGADITLAERAATLAKTDLLTGMVGEFPELQGIMGRYYATHDGEPAAVADAIAEQYQPRFAGDALPASTTGTVLALADKLETLAGLFGIGQLPTGDKDPFALRRHALGVLRMLIEKRLALSLDTLIDAACAAFPAELLAAPVKADAKPAKPTRPLRESLRDFFHDRLAGYLRELGYSANEVAAVVDPSAVHLADLPARLQALREFAALPEAQALAGANKRIGNILKKTEPLPPGAAIDASRLVEPAEQALAQMIADLEPQIAQQMQGENFSQALLLLAQARGPVDAFFDQVMVMAEEASLRANRLAILSRLQAMMNQVADISRLAA